MRPTGHAMDSNAGDMAVARLVHTSRDRRSSMAGNDIPAPTIEPADSVERIRDRSCSLSIRDVQSFSNPTSNLETEHLRMIMEERRSERQHQFELARLWLQLAQVKSSKAIPNPSLDRLPCRSWRADPFCNRMNGIDKLEGAKDFLDWSFRVYQTAFEAGISGHFNESVPQPDHDTPIERIVWTQDRSAISGSIYTGVGSAVLLHLKQLGHNASPKMIWDELKRLYDGQDSNRLSGIWEEIIDASYSTTEDFDTWLASIRERRNALVGTDFALSDRAFEHCIIRAMPSLFDIPIAVLRQTPDNQRNLIRTIVVLREHYEYHKKANCLLISSSNSAEAFAATQGFTYLRPPPLDYKRTGGKDPEFAIQMANRCRACWGRSHTLYSESCPHFEIRVAAGWQSSGQAKSSKKKSKSKKANATETMDSSHITYLA